MSLLHEITGRAQALSPLEPVDDAPAPASYVPAPLRPAPLNTIELGHHHPSGGYLAVFAGDRGIGATRLEALGRLVEQGAFGRFHLLDLT